MLLAAKLASECGPPAGGPHLDQQLSNLSAVEE